MLDPATVNNERMRDTGRWGYTGETLDDPVPVEEPGGINRWLVAAAVIALVIIAFIALTGGAL